MTCKFKHFPRTYRHKSYHGLRLARLRRIGAHVLYTHPSMVRDVMLFDLWRQHKLVTTGHEPLLGLAAQLVEGK